MRRAPTSSRLGEGGTDVTDDAPTSASWGMMVSMDRIARLRAAVAVIASVPLLGLPLGGMAAGASSGAASIGGECDQARCSPPGIVVRGRNNGARDDRIAVRAIKSAAGAEAHLFRRKNGELVKIATKVLNDKGNARFEVSDLNGRAYTKYIAKVEATEDTSRSRGARKVR